MIPPPPGLNWVRALTDDANWIGGCFEWYPTKESPVGTSTDVYWNDRPGATTGNYGGHKICVRDETVTNGLTDSGERINSGSPCAVEGGTCACTEGVWYGAGDKWTGPKQGDDASALQTLPSGTGCWEVTSKEGCCGFLDGRPDAYGGQPCVWREASWAPTNPVDPARQCDVATAVQGQGDPDKCDPPVPCNNDVFGDPAPGIVKECRCGNPSSWQYPICSAPGGPMSCTSQMVGSSQTFLIKQVD